MWSQFLFCCWLFISFGSCVPFKGSPDEKGELCDISASDKCPHQPCCGYIKFFPSSVHRVLQSVTGCVCNKDCQRKRISCKHGKCDKVKGKCVCEHCWRGPQCDKFANKARPVVPTKKLHVFIELTHPINMPVATITATDKDKELCNKNSDCPCGDLVYKLDGTSEEFEIDRDKGSLSLKQPPTLKKYDLVVTVENVGDEYTDNKVILKVEVLVRGLLDEEVPVVHHRSRRAIATAHPLLVEASPYLETSYYFNKGDEISFKIKITYNGTTGSNVEAISVNVTSRWLVLSNPVAHEFTSTSLDNQVATYAKDTLTATSSFYGNVTGTVKDNVTPLSSLSLDITANATFESNDVIITSVQSTPIVYAVFPEVNVSRDHSNIVDVYGSLGMKMSISLPVLNYSLLVELTTNVENYVFMEIKNATISFIGYDGSGEAIAHSSQGNGETDQVVINFGYITIPEVLDASERNIVVSFVVKVNDHPLVANGSAHWFGVGLQAGPSALWVEQQGIQVKKVEPALELTITRELLGNFTRLYIDEMVTITYNISHANTSLTTAHDLSMTLSTEYFSLTEVLEPNNGFTQINTTKFAIGLNASNLNEGSILQGKIKMTLLKNISPLLSVPITMELNYKNGGGVAKRPVVTTLTSITTGTPLITYEMITNPDVVTPGMRRTFTITILLTKMRSPIDVEIVMPVANGSPVMAILSHEVVSIGSNIMGLNSSATATFVTTTSHTSLKDQAIINLGTGINELSSTTNSPVNQIKLRFESIVVENSNITNGSTYWVGAGVIGKPKMVWIGQVAIKTYISSNRRPNVNFVYNSTKMGDIYTFNLVMNHTESSDQVAYNVTFEYYLPPYLEFVNSTTSSLVQKVGGKTRFSMEELFFTSDITHSIAARLRREKSPQTGKVNFEVPLRLEYTNAENSEKWQYWKSVRHSMEVLSRAPIIPKSARAKSNFYGRGFYIDTESRHVYVCMSQHVMSQTPACYHSDDDGAKWIALDSRIGSVLGHDSTRARVLHAIARNQVTYMKYNTTEDEWYPIVDSDFPMDTFSFKNVENANWIEPQNVPPAEYTGDLFGKQFTGTDDGLFYRPTIGDAWVLRAKWRLK